jgi:hypothetical protein
LAIFLLASLDLSAAASKATARNLASARLHFDHEWGSPGENHGFLVRPGPPVNEAEVRRIALLIDYVGVPILWGRMFFDVS